MASERQEKTLPETLYEEETNRQDKLVPFITYMLPSQI